MIPTIIIAGATGELGRKIAHQLVKRGAVVKALVRDKTNQNTLSEFRSIGVSVVSVNYQSVSSLAKACAGATCVVSALSGVGAVIVETQSRLLEALVQANVPRFIPSDYCIDYTKMPRGKNRNLEWRREFSQRLDKAPVRATSIFNGMFTDLLIGPAPVVLFPIKRVLYWGDADQPMDFTTIDDTAAFTAAAALDPLTPRYLRIGGEVASVRGLQRAATAATGKKFGLLRPGGLYAFKTMITLTRTVAPGKNKTFPAWQGMQYLYDMFTGLPKLEPLDNDRYPEVEWTSVEEVLAKKRWKVRVT